MRLALNERTKGIEAEVEAKDGKVWVTGTILTGKKFSSFDPLQSGVNFIEAEIRDLAQKIPGVKEANVALKGTPVSGE